jgi:hypothetical protein
MRQELEGLRDLAPIAQTLRENPDLRTKLQQLMHTAMYPQAAAAAPQVIQPSAPTAEAIAAEKDRLLAGPRSKLAAGDVEGALYDVMMTGAQIARETMQSQIRSGMAANGAAIANGAIQSFKETRRATAPKSFTPQIERRFDEQIAQIPAEARAQLVQQGQLDQALRTIYHLTLGQAYEEAQSRRADTAPPQRRAAPPNYAAGGPTGNVLNFPTQGAVEDETGDELDPEVEAALKATGTTLRMGRNGEILW